MLILVLLSEGWPSSPTTGHYTETGNRGSEGDGAPTGETSTRTETCQIPCVNERLGIPRGLAALPGLHQVHSLKTRNDSQSSTVVFFPRETLSAPCCKPQDFPAMDEDDGLDHQHRTSGGGGITRRCGRSKSRTSSPRDAYRSSSGIHLVTKEERGGRVEKHDLCTVTNLFVYLILLCLCV